jgi:DNA-binding response OmpR family regulator
VAKRILVADDEEEIAHMWQEGLTLEGYDVRKATQSLRFYDAVVDYRPDAIVLDIRMPYLHGDDELELLHLNPALSNIPVIIVTAYRHDIPDPARLKQLGVVEIIDKPTTIDVISASLKRALA